MLTIKRVPSIVWVVLLLSVSLTLNVPLVQAQVPACDQTYVVAQGDHLSKIAEQFYGDRNLWRVIYDATNAAAQTDASYSPIANPNIVLAGQKLCIPVLSAPAATPVGAATTSRLTADALMNATYVGIYDQPVTLTDGKYEGEPFSADSPMRPTVTMGDRLIAYGDLNDDGVEDAAVILVENSGGSGSFNYVAAVLNVGGMPVNPAVQALGDRVEIKSMVIDGSRITTEIVTQGPDDPFCCPTLLLRQTFQVQGNQLPEVARQELGTVSYQTLDGTEWVLAEAAFGKPALAGSQITAAFAGDKLAGSAGCNTYSAAVKPGDGQSLTIRPAASTMMACADQTMMGQETQYLQLLGGVSGWSYLAGQLALNYTVDDTYGSLLFNPQSATPQPGASPVAQPTEVIETSSAAVTTTQVITFTPDVVPAGEMQPGSCWTNSLAAGGREDAWRCSSDNAISDPCFQVADDSSVVVCNPDPTANAPGFTMRLSEPLPAPNVPAAAQEAYQNNGWLLVLADGTVCGFATGATTGIGDKRANYLCANTEWLILGDLQPGTVWQAEMALITIGDNGPELKQSKMADVRTLWR